MSYSPSPVQLDSQAELSFQSWPCCRLLGPAGAERSSRRLAQVTALGLNNNSSIPAFEEAVDLAARFLNAPMGWVSVADDETDYLKATYGLTHLGLGNVLSQRRQRPLTESLSAYVLDSEQPLVLPDTAQLAPVMPQPGSPTHGIVAYCAVPLVTTDGHCIGTLAVMDLCPRPFTEMAVNFLSMAARWAMGEYERTRPLSPTPEPPAGFSLSRLQSPPEAPSPLEALRLNLVGQLTQDLRSPLTTVLGMTDMLTREIYGPLTDKQREYTGIAHRNSQALITQLDAIIELGLFNLASLNLVPSPVDIDLLGQQVITTLASLAEKSAQTLSMTVEPGETLWMLDKPSTKQILYHLGFSLMQLGGENSTIRLHGSRKGQTLAIAGWLSNPWLGEGLPPVVVKLCQPWGSSQSGDLNSLSHGSALPLSGVNLSPQLWPPELLGFSLIQRLAAAHGGSLTLQGNTDAGYRFMVSLTPLATPAALANPA